MAARVRCSINGCRRSTLLRSTRLLAQSALASLALLTACGSENSSADTTGSGTSVNQMTNQTAGPITNTTTAAPPPPSFTAITPADIPDHARYERTDRIDLTVFNTLTAWWECLTLSAQVSPPTIATCEISDFRLVARDRATGTETIVATMDLSSDEGRPLRCDFDMAGVQVGTCRGANYRRWENGRVAYYERQDEPGGKTPIANSLVSAGVLTIDAAQRAHSVAHGWTNIATAPYRPPALIGRDYYVEVRVRVRNAAFRTGLDGWRHDADMVSCPGNEEYGCRNRQAFQGPWITTGNDFVVMRFTAAAT